VFKNIKLYIITLVIFALLITILIQNHQTNKLESRINNYLIDDLIMQSRAIESHCELLINKLDIIINSSNTLNIENQFLIYLEIHQIDYEIRNYFYYISSVSKFLNITENNTIYYHERINLSPLIYYQHNETKVIQHYIIMKDIIFELKTIYSKYVLNDAKLNKKAIMDDIVNLRDDILEIIPKLNDMINKIYDV